MPRESGLDGDLGGLEVPDLADHHDVRVGSQDAAEAVSAGYYTSPGWGQDYPRIQILTVGDLLHDATVKMPPQQATFREAQRARLSGETHPQLDL